jgi:heme/copper-type cytochrome/quinol oxidase subunit 2
VIIVGLILAVGIPLLVRLAPMDPRTRTIVLEAKRYGYSPSRIVVNRGDKVVLKPTSLDVTHGFLLDGYPVEFIIKQKGINFLKYTWNDDQ